MAGGDVGDVGGSEVGGDWGDLEADDAHEGGGGLLRGGGRGGGGGSCECAAMRDKSEVAVGAVVFVADDVAAGDDGEGGYGN